MGDSHQRLFVGNLPPNIKEQELQNEFSAYGSVKKVEVKHKKRPDSEDILSTFAFITIGADERMLKQCVQEFKDEKFRGRFLQVSVARENFLEKLKREREEAAQNQAPHASKKPEIISDGAKSLPTFKSTNEKPSRSSSSEDSSSDDEPVPPKSTPTPVPKVANGVKKAAKSSSSSSSSSESESSDDEIDLIMRKKSKAFLENGKIKIDHTVSAGGAIHIIERKSNRTVKKVLDEKSQKADQKRIQSLNKMKDSYTQQKNAIKAALATVDSTKSNNKIVFSESEDEIVATKATSTNQKSKSATKPKDVQKNLTLFDDDDNYGENEDYSKGFAIKEQFEGAKGAKLMRLQSRFQNDLRFNMDAKFLDDDYGDEGEANDGEEGHRSNRNGHYSHANSQTAENDDERQWQYNIIESVTGKKINQGPPAPSKDSKKKGPQTMLRFDPTRAEHTKFVEAKKRKAPKLKDDKNAAKRFRDDNEHDGLENNMPDVSSEQYFKVSNRLTSSIGQSTGFSLLQMFGRGNSNDATNEKTLNQSRYEEIPIAQNVAKGLADLNPFSYDSSGDEDDVKRTSKTKTAVVGGAEAGKIWHETFFMLNLDDVRFTEGLTLFLAPERPPEDDQERASKRQELRNIVKKKIKKSVRNALPRHAKPNKRFKRMAKDF